MADGITRIAVEGFKSISKKQSIDIAPLTILAGANSSGKSSIMQPLLMLKQTLEATYDPGPLKIDGPNVKFTSGDQFFSRNENTISRLSIEVGTQHFEFHVTFARGSKFAAEVLEEREIRENGILTIHPRMSEKEIREAMEETFGDPEYWTGPLSIAPERFFLDVSVASSTTFRAARRIAPLIQGVIHVPGLRANPSRTYPVTAVGPGFSGTFDHYTASVIEHWQSEKSEKAHALNDDLQHLGLARRVVARRLNESEIDLRVSRTGASKHNDTVSVADVGFGVPQILPVLVALQAADKGRLVYLEEPETHIHPRAQVKLADILACAAKRGVRVVAETHSTLLLTAIQTLVAKGELKPELVKLHWFQRDPKTGVTKVNSTGLDENGAFSDGDWPEDFDEVILSADGGYLDAVAERSAR